MSERRLWKVYTGRVGLTCEWLEVCAADEAAARGLALAELEAEGRAVEPAMLSTEALGAAPDGLPEGVVGP